MIYLFLAEGFEETEALVPLDILRRANIEIKTVGISNKTVIGAHNIPVTADLSENEITFENLSGIILPGGIPGTLNLEKSDIVQKAIDYANKNSLLICAICAAPSILGHKGLLNGIKATCFTGFEKDLLGATVLDMPVVSDKNYITAYGAGAAFQFGFKILEYLKDADFTDNLKKSMRYIGE